MRPSIDKTMLSVALVLAERATCSKLSVGCVLTDVRGRIIGTGYNGVPHGLPHCSQDACPGWGAPSGSNSCCAVHAEMNAILSCSDTQKIDTCYVNYAPCLQCAKTLLNTSCNSIVYLNEVFEPAARSLWLSAGRNWLQYRE